MPALVNSSVGSSLGSKDEEGTSRCPRATKKSRNSRRIWAERIGQNIGERFPISYQPTPPRRPGACLSQRAGHGLQRLAAGEASSGKKGEQPPPLDRAREVAELGGALGGEGRRQPPPVGVRGPLLGDGAIHDAAGDPHRHKIPNQASGAATA